MQSQSAAQQHRGFCRGTHAKGVCARAHFEEVPFHTVARLTLMPKSQLPPDAAKATYIDVTGNSTPDSTPIGSINRARYTGEVASRKARTRGTPVVNIAEPRTKGEVIAGTSYLYLRFP
jgi:hypothetical protein